MSSEQEARQELTQLRARLAQVEEQARAAEERARRAEEAAAGLRSEANRVQRFEELIGYMPVILWESWFQTSEDHQRVGFVSDYILTLSGYTREEWLSSDSFWTDLIHPDDRERIIDFGSIITRGNLQSGVAYAMQRARPGRRAPSPAR